MRIYIISILFLQGLMANSQDSTVISLDTVVVNTGYGRVKPNEVNGVVTVISNKELNQQTGTNVLQRLNNVTSGLLFNVGKSNSNPQNKTNISIRGLGTINGPLDPLIVIDNFIYEGSIENINPNDVETISILKDAGATSIYGARGGNGVIVITTKKAKFADRIRVEANITNIVTQKPNLSNIPQVSSAELVELEIFLFNQGYFDGQILQGYSPLTPLIATLLARRDGLISAQDSAQQIARYRNIDTHDEYRRSFYKLGLTQQYALNIRGGSEKLAWLISGAYDRLNNELDARNNKINLRFSNTYKPTKGLQVDVNVYFTSTNARNGKPAFAEVSRIGGRYVPYLQYTDENGQPLTVTSNWRKTFTDTAGQGLLLDWNYRPLEEYTLLEQRSKSEDIVASVGLTYQVLPWLTAQLSYQHQRQMTTIENNADEKSYYARNLINQFSQINYSTGTVRRVIPNGGILFTSEDRQLSRQGRFQLNGVRTIRNHKISAFTGAEIREIESYSNGQTLYGYRKDPLIYTPIDPVNTYTNLVTGWSQNIPGLPGLSATNSRFISVYTNLSYNWMDRYHITGSARKDGSNILGVSSNNQWKPLWSAGVGWTISKEGFYKIDWLTYLKLRLTYGKSGNVDLSLSALPVANFQTNPVTQLPYAQIEVLNNPSLRWEQVSQWNVGIEFGTKNKMLSGSIDYYRKRGTDLYGNAPYDYTTWGYRGDIKRNVASMKGTGIDMQLNSQISTGQVQWNATLLYNYNRAITTKYYTDISQQLTNLIGNGSTINPSEGKPLYVVASYRWGGLDAEGDPMGYLNGKLSKDYTALFNDINEKGDSSTAIIINGPATPTSFGALINTISWHKFSVTVNVSYRLGFYFIRPALSYGSLVQQGEGYPEYALRWQKPGDEKHTNVPAFKYPLFGASDAFYTSSSVNVSRADHFRLEYVQLSYTWKFAQLYLNASNLGLLWRKSTFDIDPEYAGRIAPPKNYTIGLRLNW